MAPYVLGMYTCVVRVWLPDRPGALGSVAGAIGTVGGEIVGIDILERGGGRAVDELAVELAGDELVPALIRAVDGVDGVDVEEVRTVDGGVHDPRTDALEVAAVLIGAGDRHGVLEALVEHGRRLLGGTWAAVVHLSGGEPPVGSGPAPDGPWLDAFVAGSRSSALVAAGAAGPEDVVWAPLPASGLALVVGRVGVTFRARERRQVASLARIADARVVGFARRAHPSGTW